jgi:hypothetical protein
MQRPFTTSQANDLYDATAGMRIIEQETEGLITIILKS